MVETEVGQPGEPIIARRGRDHRRTRAFRELDRRDADATRAGLDQHRLARLETTELEQAVVGGAVGNGHARHGDDVGTVGHGPGQDRRHHGELGVRAPEVGRDDPLSDLPVGHARADLTDRARTLVTDHVRHGRHLAARGLRVSPPSMLIASTSTSTPPSYKTGSGTSS